VTVVPHKSLVTCEDVTSLPRIFEIGSQWDILAEQVSPNTIFLNHNVFVDWLRTFGQQTECHILCVWRGERLVGVLPTLIHREKLRGLNVNVLRFTSNGAVSRFQPLFDIGDTVTPSCLARQLIDLLPKWDVAKFDDVCSESEHMEVVIAASKRLSRSVLRRPGKRSPYLPISGSYREYLASRSQNFRAKITRAWRYLERSGALKIVHSIGFDPVAISEAVDVSARSWKAKEGYSMGRGADWLEFYRSLGKYSEPDTRVMLSMLRLNDKAIAIVISLGNSQRLECIRADFDEEFAEYSPGFLLLSSVVDECFRLGVSEYDFGGQAYSHKRRFTSDIRPHHTYWLFSDSTKARILRAALRLRDRLRLSQLPNLPPSQ
jgi:CelD/BcsL family acetyltransferase involved in cellulose biosynthesis